MTGKGSCSPRVLERESALAPIFRRIAAVPAEPRLATGRGETI